jgi:hypothetical protein
LLCNAGFTTPIQVDELELGGSELAELIEANRKEASYQANLKAKAAHDSLLQELYRAAQKFSAVAAHEQTFRMMFPTPRFDGAQRSFANAGPAHADPADARIRCRLRVDVVRVSPLVRVPQLVEVIPEVPAGPSISAGVRRLGLLLSRSGRLL